MTDMMNDEKWIRIMKAGERLGCHQMPERSFSFRGYQFPVCARCTGVLLSGAAACFLFFKKKLPVKLCIAFSGVMFMDWLAQFLKIKESTNFRRFLTGLFGGFGYTTLHLYLYWYLIKKLMVHFDKQGGKSCFV